MSINTSDTAADRDVKGDQMLEAEVEAEAKFKEAEQNTILQ